MTKRPKKSNQFKAGPANSKYRLYVEFLPGYDHPRKSFNYFSNDRKGSDKGLDDLLRRVLNDLFTGFDNSLAAYTNILIKTTLSGFLAFVVFSYGELFVGEGDK